jgi:hypothetical protein
MHQIGQCKPFLFLESSYVDGLDTLLHPTACLHLNQNVQDSQFFSDAPRGIMQFHKFRQLGFVVGCEYFLPLVVDLSLSELQMIFLRKQDVVRQF